ncbi:MAG: hypothetical protein K2H65_02910, partial [Bacteroidales bacterium]|nr:hypothetical protein [Bacteroidales bacterium]
MKNLRLTLGTAALGLAAVLAFSCRSAHKGLPYADPENAPVQAVYNSVSAFTDSGRVQMTMESPLMYNYSDEKGTQIF